MKKKLLLILTIFFSIFFGISLFLKTQDNSKENILSDKILTTLTREELIILQKYQINTRDFMSSLQTNELEILKTVQEKIINFKKKGNNFDESTIKNFKLNLTDAENQVFEKYNHNHTAFISNLTSEEKLLFKNIEQKISSL